MNETQSNLGIETHAEMKVGTGSVEVELRRRLRRANAQVVEVLTDTYGRYGVVTRRSVILGKQYDIDGLVSVHLHAVEYAASKQKNLMLLVGSRRCFYRFDPKELLGRLNDGTAELNFRGNTPFINFMLSDTKQVSEDAEGVLL